MKLCVKITDSLQKIFADEEFSCSEYTSGSALRGEVFSFQIAYCCDEFADIYLKKESDLDITCREVQLIPCETPALDLSEDPFVLRSTAGLYPDALVPQGRFIKASPRQWRSFWITVNVSENTRAGKHNIAFKLTAQSNRGGTSDTKECSFELDVLEQILPEQKLIQTQWFHADCLYVKYNCACWSEKHWEVLEKYFLNFSAHGNNMLLTPLWTPPLDTAKDKERPTVQLLDIELCKGKYRFDFTRLGRWIDLGLKCNIKYFEMSHIFTQWGAEHAPKIIVKIDGKEQKLFGWHTDSLGAEYTDFLRQLFPQLLEYLDSRNVREKCYFHVSDEPGVGHIPVYSKCSALVNELAGGKNIIDALSSFEFYRNKLVKIPIPSNNHIEDFYAGNVKPLWTYYCCSQTNQVPNRFFNFPSMRSRVMGVLMYVYDIAGFLQWGYNFWYSRHSVRTDIDPYRVTDADHAFPSGDAFAVYPAEDGPVDSIRHEVMREAIQDMRALQLLEGIIGREKTLEVIHDGLDGKLTMTNYPHSASWLLDLRRKVNKLISAN